MEVKSALRNLVRAEEGASAIEYGILAALIIGVLVGVIAVLGGHIDIAFNNFVKTLSSLL